MGNQGEDSVDINVDDLLADISEPPTKSRINELILLAKLGEASDALEKASNALRVGKSLDDPATRVTVVTAVSSVRASLQSIGEMLIRRAPK